MWYVIGMCVKNMLLCIVSSCKKTCNSTVHANAMPTDLALDQGLGTSCQVVVYELAGQLVKPRKYGLTKPVGSDQAMHTLVHLRLRFGA